jgi:peptidoglycan hydrolase CwlO-like protein
MNETILLFLSNAVTGLVAWFAGKRRTNAETDSVVLKNLELSVNLYAQIIQSLKEEIESLNVKIQDLERKVDELHAENKKLKQTSSIKITK